MAEINNKFENIFWLQIMGDHARVVDNALPPNEAEYLRGSDKFISIFDTLLTRAKENLTDEQMMQLNRDAFRATQDYRKFELEIINEQLVGTIQVYLTPAFFNHTVNESEEYLNILGAYLQNKQPDISSVHLDLLWLLDGSGHAYALSENIGSSYRDLNEKCIAFGRRFDELFLKSVEMRGFLRGGLKTFPALTASSIQGAEEHTAFREFVGELMVQVRQKTVLGTLYPLMLDHMYRESCYYVTKLSTIIDVPEPDCDPLRPRQESL